VYAFISLFLNCIAICILNEAFSEAIITSWTLTFSPIAIASCALCEAVIESFLTGKSYEEEKKNGDAGQSTGSQSLDTSLNSAKPTQEASTVVNNIQSEPVAAPAAGKLSPQEILAKLKARQQG
jgi:hypothetical protein